MTLQNYIIDEQYGEETPLRRCAPMFVYSYYVAIEQNQ